MIGFIPYLYTLRRRVKFYIIRTWLNLLKMLCAILIVLGNLSELALRISDYFQGRHVWVHQLLSPGFLFLATTVSVFVAEFERRKSVRTSIFLAGFWIISSTLYTVRFRSAIIRGWYQNPCPSSSASVPSRLFFFWPARLVWQGFKKPLELEDMWDLQRAYTCQHNHDVLNNNWQKEVERSQRNSALTVEIQPADQIPTRNTIRQTSTVNIAQNSSSKSNPSLLKAVLKTFWFPCVCGVMLQLAHTLVVIIIPQILRKLIQFSEDREVPVYSGVVYAFLLLVASVVKCLLFHHMIIIQDKQGQCISTAVMAMVYKKSLKLTPDARKESTTGEIVNLMSSDCNGYFALMTVLRTICNLPFHIVLTMVALWGLLGPSSMVGLLVILIIIPVNLFIARIRKRIEVKRKKIKDSRIKEINEVLFGIKIIKLHAWESSFERRINDFRKEEVTLLKYSTYLMALSDCIHSFLPFLVALCTFAVYVLCSDDHLLTAEKAFVSLAYFQVLQQPLIMLSRVVRDLVHTTVAHKRLHTLLTREELDSSSVLNTGLNDYSVIIRHGNFSWSKHEAPVLKNIELLVPRGSITAIVGTVGSGKSSLLSACLGELLIIGGTVNVKGSVGYVAQHTWLMQASIRENILFGRRYDEVIYEAVVRECALLPDLEVLPAGDMTQLGEKGINLSGGQKTRLSLARAVYQDQDVYLLDDPLSALDANVARSVFDRVLGPEGMLKNKTRILVSQALWLLPQVDQIIVLQNGNVSEAGTYSSLMSNRSTFFHLYRTFSSQNPTESVTPMTSRTVPRQPIKKSRDGSQSGWRSSSSSDEEEGLIITSLPEGLNTKPVDERGKESGRPRSMMFVRSITGDQTDNNKDKKANTSSNSWQRTRQQLRKRLVAIEKKLTRAYRDDTQLLSHYFMSETDIRRPDELIMPDEPAPEHVDQEEEQDKLLQEAHDDDIKDNGDSSKIGQDKKRRLFIREEELEKGRVKMTVYATYLRAVGLIPCLCTLILCLASRGVDIASSVWLVTWSDHMSSGQQLVYNASYQLQDANYNISSPSIDNASRVSDGKMNSEAVLDQTRGYYIKGYAILGAIGTPMSFFEETPLGRLLNRFGGDVTAMDLRLPAEFRNLMKLMVGALGCVVVVAMVTPWSLFAWFALGSMYSFVQVVFVPNLRQVRRLISVNHSPIFSQFTETLQGVTTIRAFSAENKFTEMFYSRVNNLLKILYVGYHFNRFLSVVIEGIGATSVFLAALLAVLARDRLSAGLLALSVTYVSQITHYLNWLVRLTSACESDIVSVERIKEYVSIPPEGSCIRVTKTPDRDWPSSGAIELNNYSTTYRSGIEMVLKGISCHIYPGEKVGIVGRTGAGKTTLTMALFRMVEASQGTIYIDDVNIAEIPLQHLRKRLTIIPQDPALFSGTLRFNLDPFSVHKEDDIWRVLKLSHLAEMVQGLPGKLNFNCSEGCHNISAGQRQLLCLARALLRKSRILILDEATASCDVETDEVIQKTIRDEFIDCTVITVAHRLNTIKDYDRIMVLDNGVLKELDTPQKLMDDPTTLFYTMAKNAGLIQSAFYRH
ncbi:hypothetical protein LSH36_1142g00052 [Paralvinella palmiformis]|uniref:Multidrug resistance-associated protein 1 n=1 Tax=Paralvinella palmiformis TaxID=53620 RepID=A0AAD9IUM5_9ANNE|nr:hypothetical protein LSH36_1142g00052 [Paralvinella palmiformis]